MYILTFPCLPDDGKLNWYNTWIRPWTIQRVVRKNGATVRIFRVGMKYCYILKAQITNPRQQRHSQVHPFVRRLIILPPIEDSINNFQEKFLMSLQHRDLNVKYVV